MSRDIPIMFSTAMVLALLGGRKRMTRRLAWKNPFPAYGDDEAEFFRERGCKVSGPDDCDARICWPPSPWQKVKAGDRLWVREEWRVGNGHDAISPSKLPERQCTIMFTAGGSIANSSLGWTPDPLYPSAEPNKFPDWAGRRRASMHLPRWGSRITLLVKETKIERLQSISDEDCLAEGLVPWGGRHEGRLTFKHPFIENEGGTGTWAFGELWSHLHGRKSWDSNPEVVATSFSVVHANIDAAARVAA